MTWTPMFNWWGPWLLLAIVPPAIALLYFLKLRRQPLQVPSTYLWLKSIEDLHVNSIWQRLRQNLLLLLQLLLILIAVLALLRPGWRGTKLTGDRFIFLVDNSASMASTDVVPTRLGEAKRLASDLVAQMKSGDVAMVVSFSDSARVEQLFTDNRRELTKRIAAIEPTNRTTALGEALRVAAGLANPGRAAFEVSDTRVADSLPATLYIFSDGKFPDVEGFSLGNLKPVLVPIGLATSPNLGITAFSTQRPEGASSGLQAFGRVENAGPETVSATVELLIGGEVADAKKVDIKSHEAGSVVFPLEEQEGAVELRVSPGGALPVDDVARTTVNAPRRSRVLLATPGNEALEYALAASQELAEISTVKPGYLESKEYLQAADSGGYDLVIYDQCRPAAMPQANTLFIGRLPPSPKTDDAAPAADAKPAAAAWRADAKVSGPEIIDTNSAHPLMQLIDLGNVRFAELTPLHAPPGGSMLIDTNAGVLFAVAPREGFEDAVLGAEIVGVNDQNERVANTDWVLRLSFPVFARNVLKYLGGREQVANVGSVAPGQLVTLRSAAAADRLTVRTPSGKQVEIRRGKQSAYHFNETEELGVYEVLEAGKVIQRFAVNLLSSWETDIRPRETVKFGYVEVKGQSNWEGARRETWKWLLCLALGVLLVEWYIYNRRVYV